ncbi:hypothetical protein M0Q28_05435 [Patescibacteria group bacterium]|jgi:hypothetical protein|nr:hypothetical protein [Patescibacteria group bacterium]
MAQGTELDKVYTYHPPFGTQQERYVRIRDEAKSFATTILALTPKSREQSLALTKLEEVVMWANSAIARNENDIAPKS